MGFSYRVLQSYTGSYRDYIELSIQVFLGFEAQETGIHKGTGMENQTEKEWTMRWKLGIQGFYQGTQKS